MKTNYLITGEATKYWKKAIKSDRVMIANKSEHIYILNGYNAFKFPAKPFLWDAIARAAFMVDMPGSDSAFQYYNGEKQFATVDDVAQRIEQIIEDRTPAQRLPFCWDAPFCTTRLYSINNGEIAGVNVKYDAMVNIELAKKVYCKGRYAPVVIADDYITAILMPVRLDDKFNDQIEEAFAQIIEGRRAKCI